MPYKDPEKQKEAQRKHYQDNIEKYKSRNKTYRQKVRDLVKEIKEKNPCTDCNIFFPYYVMQFDHINDNKIKTVAYFTNYGTVDQTLEEIEKCELVCANCHAKRTWERINGLRY